MSIVFLNSFIMALVLTPIVRKLAKSFDIMDHPSSEIKTHIDAIPYLGGLSIIISFCVTLLFHAHSYSDIFTWKFFLPVACLFILGTLDDIYSFSARFRFMVQFIIYIIFVLSTQKYIPITGFKTFDMAFTIVWLVGITNAFNIIDIMDGLSSGVAIIAAGFLVFLSYLTGLSTTAILCATLAGACLGFIGFNFSQRFKIFMGDGGSTLIGSILGMSVVLYCQNSPRPVVEFIGLFLLLGIPIYDTFLVMLLRIKKGISPFKGSRDHFALRMVQLGFSRKLTVISAYIVTFAFGLISVVNHQLNIIYSLALFVAVVFLGITWGMMLSIIDVEA